MNWVNINHIHELLHMAAATFFIIQGISAILDYRNYRSQFVLSFSAMCLFSAVYALHVTISHNLPKPGEFWIPWTDAGLVVTFLTAFLYLLTVGQFLNVKSRLFTVPLVLLGAITVIAFIDLLTFAVSHRSFVFIPEIRENIAPHQFALGEGSYSLLIMADILPFLFIVSFVGGVLFLLVELIRKRSNDTLIYIGLFITSAAIINDSLTALSLYKGVYLLAFSKGFEAVRIRRDISRRSQVNLERRVHEAEMSKLEHLVQDRTAQLEALNKELEAFAYSISHDLRAPLRHIDGFVNLLISDCHDRLDEKGMHYVNTISSSAHKMGVLIEGLLTFSRTGRAEMHRDDIDMNKIVSEAKDLLHESYANRNIEWIIDDLPSGRGDYVLIRQVWMNLLENAIKYTRKRKTARLEIRARKENDEIVYSISDNGVGFDMKNAEKLFGVFQRLYSQEEFEGTGIGLATVRRIITRHGGRVWAQGAVDQGATFYFTLAPNVSKLKSMFPVETPPAKAN